MMTLLEKAKKPQFRNVESLDVFWFQSREHQVKGLPFGFLAFRGRERQHGPVATTGGGLVDVKKGMPQKRYLVLTEKNMIFHHENTPSKKYPSEEGVESNFIVLALVLGISPKTGDPNASAIQCYARRVAYRCRAVSLHDDVNRPVLPVSGNGSGENVASLHSISTLASVKLANLATKLNFHLSFGNHLGIYGHLKTPLVSQPVNSVSHRTRFDKRESEKSFRGLVWA